MENVYAVAGSNVQPGLERKIVVICKALYGLVFFTIICPICSREWNSSQHVLIMTCGLDSKWTRSSMNNVMAQIKAAYTMKLGGPPKYYLGNDFKHDSKGR
eukprot:9527580-Ditylum_brightwellii.AAC.2